MNRLFVDNLTVIDFSYLDQHRGLLGESLMVDIELAGDLNDEGMLFDFGHVKKQIKQIIDNQVDHKLLVPEFLSDLSIKYHLNQIMLSREVDSPCYLKYSSPTSSVLVLPVIEITPIAIQQYLEDEIRQHLPINVTDIRIQLRTEKIKGVEYQYSHGLKKHQGNCQRIAHGHRSTLNIWQNNIASPQLETEWASLFKDIYIGTREDIQSENELCITFKYESAQGEFEIALSPEAVYLIETDSTVEWIANHIASELKNRYPESRFKVKAFEGVGKGSIAETE
jgi:6-pyruvoyl-tetrahydropterin synthase